MSIRVSDRVPTYRRKRTKSGPLAVVTLPDGLGNRRDVLLGRYGTASSRQEYARVIAEWEAAGRRLLAPETRDITVTELIGRFLPWMQNHYRHADGTPTKEVAAFLYSLRPLRHLYGGTPAEQFGPLALKAVRDLMVRGYEHPKYGPQGPLSRGVTNQRVKRVRRLFKWAVENELVSATVLHALQAVAGLQRGRTEARETDPVRPVARAVVEDTLPLLQPMVADMVRLQLLTGMRSGELVTMRACEIDTTGKVWLYRPAQHKTMHHGHGRVVPLGPAAQEIVRRHLVPDMQAVLFSPARCTAERRAALRAARKSRVQPSQVSRAKKRTKRRPGAAYTTASYGRSIAAAIARHNDGKPEADQVPHWHPHQLRHLRASELKREAGLDVARAVLGHRSPVISEHYAGLDVAKAAEIMERIG
jgi:integrase